MLSTHHTFFSSFFGFIIWLYSTVLFHIRDLSAILHQFVHFHGDCNLLLSECIIFTICYNYDISLVTQCNEVEIEKWFPK